MSGTQQKSGEANESPIMPHQLVFDAKRLSLIVKVM